MRWRRLNLTSVNGCDWLAGWKSTLLALKTSSGMCERLSLVDWQPALHAGKEWDFYTLLQPKFPKLQGVVARE
ncbi:hypothetical protein BaRGS_00001996, partial [Batillaria attramentaria]